MSTQRWKRWANFSRPFGTSEAPFLIEERRLNVFGWNDLKASNKLGRNL
jgi:hypothetical protein